MVLEDYFDFKDYAEFGEIRIQGHRIWLQDVYIEHLRNGLSAPELMARFPSLDPDKIYASLLYYYANRQEMDGMMERYYAYLETSKARFAPAPRKQSA